MKTVTLIIFTIFFSANILFGQSSKDSLIVFVGEIIEVKYWPEEKKPIDTFIVGKDTSYAISISMDSRYFAKYKVLKLIHGTYKADTIEFTVFDHYGKPYFSRFTNVLLFVSIIDGKLYHSKYQFFSLYLTKKGKWASPYLYNAYIHPFKNQITVKPQKIKFKNKISYSLDKLTNEQINTRYPAPYYKIKKGRAFVVYGNYIDDLFKLKQQTVFNRIFNL
jgi:hypothetical protein